MATIRRESMRLEFDDVIFDAECRQLWIGGQEARLSPKAFDLLALLIARQPNAVSKSEIHDHLWPGTFVSDSNLPSLASEIREALRDRDRARRLIRTLHGRGYSFQAPGAESSRHELAHRSADGWLVGATDEIALFAGENVLGREGPGVTLLKASAVSRRHARIVIDADRVVVEDLGSKNGTYVNDRRVNAPTPVVDGDQVRIGSLLFTFHRPQPGGSTQTLSSRTGFRSQS